MRQRPPGGVLRRAGHTEAAVDLARLAGLREAGVLIEDSERRVALVNERFIQIFGIPLPPVAIVGQEATDLSPFAPLFEDPEAFVAGVEDRKSTRLNSSHT